MESRTHCQPGFLAKVNPPQKLSTYEVRETVGLFHILKWISYVGIDLSTNSWQAVECSRQRATLDTLGRVPNSHLGKSIY
jgi:hypothetical protein